MDKEKKKMEFTRRQFLKGALITGAAIGVGGANVLLRPGAANAAVFAQSPQLAKWIQPIRNLDILKRPGDNPCWNPNDNTKQFLGLTRIRRSRPGI